MIQFEQILNHGLFFDYLSDELSYIVIYLW